MHLKDSVATIKAEAKREYAGTDNHSIRYSCLVFTLEFITSASVPTFKGSTLRGGIGDILLGEHCIRDGNCRTCSFRHACVVPNIYYHPLKIVPASVNDGGSLGYTFECLDRRTHVRPGDRMQFSLLLYGDVIVYFTTILDAVYRLGMAGIGPRQQAKFRVLRVTDQDGGILFENGSDTRTGGGTVNPRAIHIADLMQTAKKQAARRMEQQTAYDLTLHFLSPWSQKWQNEFLTSFNMQALTDSVYRRVYLMHCMEGIPFPERHEFDLSETRVETVSLGHHSTARYSNRQEAKIHLHGIEGEFHLIHVPAELLPYIFAGEIVHIGKNTSIGFGKYKVS